VSAIGIAILGFGTVGRAVAQHVLVSGVRRIRVAAVADSSGFVRVRSEAELERLLLSKHRGIPVAHGDNAAAVVPGSPGWSRRLRETGAEILVSALPTNIISGEPALSLALAALRDGMPVVLLDKGSLVHGFRDLEEAAAAGNVSIRFSGATGIVVPADLRTGSTTRIEGVLNGTTNYILSRMLADGTTFEEALAAAMRAGIAEPDPTLDIEGWDSACKLVILSAATMGGAPKLAAVRRRGIGPAVEVLVRAARASGGAVRLIAKATKHGADVELAVAPEIVGPRSRLYGIDGAAKAAAFTCADGSDRVVAAVSGLAHLSSIVAADVESLAGPAGRSPMRCG
jgi:homoserine dehydrogenase